MSLFKNFSVGLTQMLMIFPLLVIISCSPLLSKSSSTEMWDIDSTIQADSAYLAFIAPYKEQLDAEMSRVIARGAKKMIKKVGESSLGNLVADMQKDYSGEKFNQNIDISVINNGGLRNSLPQGDITVGNVYELSPFENYIYLLELEARDVENLARYIVKGKNLGISGMYVESRNGELIKYAVGGKPVDEGSTYTLAINDYLANGGDNMVFLIDLPRLVTSDVLLREMMIHQMEKWSEEGKSIDAEIEGRQNLN